MEILNDFQTSVRRALEEIDPDYEKYGALVICGTHSPQDTDSLIEKIKEARETQMPFLGICFGMQLMAIEYARNVSGIKDATSKEFGTKGTFIVQKLSELRVGIKKVSRTPFSQQETLESHWHNYYVPDRIVTEINRIETHLIHESTDEITEWIRIWSGHPFFVGVQYHPEYQSSKDKPHPLLVQFIQSCKKQNVA